MIIYLIILSIFCLLPWLFVFYKFLLEFKNKKKVKCYVIYITKDDTLTINKILVDGTCKKIK